MAAKKRKTAKRPARAGSKTEFVLGLPAEMSAKDVVAQAKEKGLKLSAAYVYKIRGRGKPSKAAKTPSPRGAKSNGALTKTDLVRSLGPDASYADAAEKAKAAGIEISKAHFYVIKSELKKKGGGRPARGKPGRQARAASRGSNGLRLASGNPTEQAFLESLRTLGPARARGLLEAFEKFEVGR